MAVSQIIISWLLSFFGFETVPASSDKSETAIWYRLALKAFALYPELRIATAKEEERNTSPHTGTAHNTDTQGYIFVRHTEHTEMPLCLKPITSNDKPLAYCLVLDTDKVSSIEKHCEQFAKLYMRKALKLKKTFGALNASLFARQSGEDRVNNLRTREKEKANNRAKLELLAAPFVAMSADMWLSVAPSIEESAEPLYEVITELRS